MVFFKDVVHYSKTGNIVRPGRAGAKHASAATSATSTALDMACDYLQGMPLDSLPEGLNSFGLGLLDLWEPLADIKIARVEILKTKNPKVSQIMLALSLRGQSLIGRRATRRWHQHSGQGSTKQFMFVRVPPGGGV